MFIFTLPIFFAILFLLLYLLTRRLDIEINLKEIILLTWLLASLFTIIVTEGLSLFSLLSRNNVINSWQLIFIFCLSLTILFTLKDPTKIGKLMREISNFYSRLLKRSKLNILLVLLIIIQMSVQLFIIDKYPVPTNGDSMRYHLARTLHWDQQANVNHFATQIINNISFPPFAEYLLLHINYLVGNDHLARLAQWLAMIISTIGVAEIAKKLGGNSQQQVIASLLCVSIPMGIGQATSTQNDYVAAAGLVCFIVFGLKYSRKPFPVFNIGITGLTLGIAFLTKGTNYIFTLPFILWFGFHVIKEYGWSKKVFFSGFSIFIIVVSINFGHFSRNISIFDSPIGIDRGTANEEISLRVLSSNIIRNAQLHNLPTRKSLPPILNTLSQTITKLTWKLHKLTGLDPTDRISTFGNPIDNYLAFSNPHGLAFNNSKAGNFIHLSLIIATMFGLFTMKNHKLRLYAVTTIIAFLLFSLLIKSHNHGSRLQLPLFVIWSPAIALSIFKSRHEFINLWVISIWVLSLPWLLIDGERPIILRNNMELASWQVVDNSAYFRTKAELFDIFDQVTTIITTNNCNNVALHRIKFEYPFWKLLEEKGFDGQIEFILVDNQSQSQELENFTPCAIFSKRKIPLYEIVPAYNDYKISTFGEYRLYTTR